MKSDSRVSIRRPSHGMPAPLSQRVVMPGWPPSTQSGDRHDRVVGPPRVAEATTAGRTWFTSLGTSSLGSRAAQFSRTASHLLRGTLRAGAIRPEGDHRVYRPTLDPALAVSRPPPPAGACAAACRPGVPRRRAPRRARPAAQPPAPCRRFAPLPGRSGGAPRCD